jgi:mannonate dehydratase
MKLGLGLYRYMLTTDSFRFAKQAGATHLVAHFVDYFKEGPRIPGASSHGSGWRISNNRGRLWTLEELREARAAINAEGLKLTAIENFDPSHWYDILLDGPHKQEQLEDVKELIRRLGKAGIPCMGYNFSLAGVWGHVVGPFARGGAESVAFLGPDGPAETSIPNGMVWNLVYNAEVPEGTAGRVTQEKLWQ